MNFKPLVHKRLLSLSLPLPIYQSSVFKNGKFNPVHPEKSAPDTLKPTEFLFFYIFFVNLELMTSKIIHVYGEVFQSHIPFTALPAQ